MNRGSSLTFSPSSTIRYVTLTGDRVNNPIDASFSGTTKKSSPCQMQLNLHRKLGIRYQGTYHWCEALSDLIWTNQVWTNIAANLLNGTLIRMSRNRIMKKVNCWSFFTLRAVDKKLKAIWTTGLVLLQHLNSYEVQCEPRLQYFIYKSTHIIYNTIIHTIYITILPHTHIVLYRYIVTKSSIRIVSNLRTGKCFTHIHNAIIFCAVTVTVTVG